MHIIVSEPAYHGLNCLNRNSVFGETEGCLDFWALQGDIEITTKFLPHSSHSSWFLLFVRGPLWRLAGERIITGLSLGPDWTEYWRQTVNNIVYALFVVRLLLKWDSISAPFLLYYLHINQTYMTLFSILWIGGFCFGAALEQCCSRAYWYDPAGPVFYWLFCHAVLCWAWFWWRSAVSTVAQFPVVWLACCQCHSTAPCGVISILSVGLCQTSGQYVCVFFPPSPHTTVSLYTLMLSNGHGAGCCS